MPVTVLYEDRRGNDNDYCRSMRDRIFSRCARELTTEARSQLLSRLPDIDRLVRRVAACLQEEALTE